MPQSLRTMSLYPLVLNHNLGDLSTNSVQTLLAISHSIEDVVMRYHLELTFYAGFQRFSSFMPQIERFSRLASICGDVIVLGVPDSPVPAIPNITFVPLERDAPLAEEWFIVAEHPEFGAVLLTRQLESRLPHKRPREVAFGRGRLYEGVVTFDDRLVGTARRALTEVLNRPFEPITRSSSGRLAFDSPYNVFGRALVSYLEQSNQQLQGLYQTLLERNRELERLQQQVRKFMSHRAWEEAQAVEPILADRRRTAEIQMLTIMMVDVEGFTRLSETIDPALLLESLNQYLNILATSVYQFGGDVDKFLGDGMLAFFENPVAALRAVVMLQRRVGSFNAQQVAARRATFPTRAGLATGVSLIGRIGSDDRQEITVLGDAVNLASRLQSKAQPGGFVLDAATYDGVGRPATVPQTLARLPGKSGVQTIYEVEPGRLEQVLQDVLAWHTAQLRDES